MTDEPSGEVILYQRDDGAPALEVRLDSETVWLSQQQIADLFQTSQQNVSLHLRNIYEEGELVETATYKDFLSVRQEGSRTVQRKVAHYNLDAIISVGYRVKSGVATRFRIWATERLREYLVKGFTMDDQKLKNLGGGQYRVNFLSASATSAAARKCCIAKCSTFMRQASTTTPKPSRLSSSSRSCRTSSTSPLMAERQPRSSMRERMLRSRIWD